MENKFAIDYQIRTTWNAISKMYTEQAAQYDYSMVMGLTLLSIDPKEGSLSMTLGPKMAIESTSLSRTLTKLEEEGMIKRMGSKVDKRHVIIKLTKKGLKMRDVSKENVIKFQSKVKEILSEKELKTLIKSLEKIQNLTQEITNELSSKK